jgi:hypothetical protein
MAEPNPSFLHLRMILTKVARVFSTYKRTEPLKFTSHLEECCQRLLMFREYESDKLLVQLVAIQQISLEISGFFNETNSFFGNSGMSIILFIKSMQGKLDDFERNLPSDFQQHRMLNGTLGNVWPKLTPTIADIICYHQSAEIGLYEIGLSHAFNNEVDEAYRLSIIYSFLLAVKTFFSTHFTSAFPMTAARAYITYAQVEYAIRMGIKLLRIPVIDGWDADHARALLDFPNAMKMVIPKFETIIRIRSRNGEHQRPPHDGQDVFVRYLNETKCLKGWSESLGSSSGSDTRGNRQVAETERQALEAADFPLAAGTSQVFSDNFVAMTDSDRLLWAALKWRNDDWLCF